MHPLGDSDPGFGFVDLGDVEITQAGPFFRNQDLFSRADNLKLIGIYSGNEERRAMAEDVIIVRAAAGVDEEEGFAVDDPVLLGVVAAEVGTIIKGPALGFVKVKSILTHGDITMIVMTNGHEETTIKVGQRGFPQTSLGRKGEFVPVLHVGEGFSGSLK